MCTTSVRMKVMVVIVQARFLIHSRVEDIRESLIQWSSSYS